jgi:hypothetical protein
LKTPPPSPAKDTREPIEKALAKSKLIPPPPADSNDDDDDEEVFDDPPSPKKGYHIPDPIKHFHQEVDKYVVGKKEYYQAKIREFAVLLTGDKDYTVKQFTDAMKDDELMVSKTLQRHLNHVKALRRSGEGRKSSNDCLKMDSNMKLGTLKFDKTKWLQGFIVAKDKNRIVRVKGRLNKDLEDLLTKKYNSRRIYNEQALEDYKKICEKANINIAKMGVGSKSKILNGLMKPQNGKEKLKVKFLHYTNPDELLERMNLLLGMYDGGNKNPEIIEELTSIVDRLHADKIITPSQYQNIIDSFL